MKRMEASGGPRREDWAQIYSKVPEEVGDGVRIAFARIRARERRRARRMRVLACAACLVLALGAGALALSGARRPPDRVTPPVADADAPDLGAVVYAAKADPFFHLRPDCPRAERELVQLKLVTALEFEKAPCPDCGARVRLAGGT